jgi:hypothetical protein
LTTLSFSDNVDLQRSAALAFAEITEKEVHEVGRDTLDPVLYLLTSHDPEVQRAASAALGNLAVNGEQQYYNAFPETNIASREQTLDRLARRSRASDPSDAEPECRGSVQRCGLCYQPCHSR